MPAAAARHALTDLPGCAADPGLGARGFTNVGYSTRTLDAKPKHRSAGRRTRSLAPTRPGPPSGRYRPGRHPERKKPDLNGRAKRLYSKKFLWLPDLGSNQGPTD